MVGPTGFELLPECQATPLNKRILADVQAECPHMGPQNFDEDCRRLARLVEAWGKLPEPLKKAIEAIVKSSYQRGD